MTRRETDPIDREERLDRAIAEFLYASATDSEADRRRWLARYPEFFDELSDFFADRDAVEMLAAPLRELAITAEIDPDPDWLGPSEVPDHLGRIGPYEVLDRVGRGGMGVVYKAHDAALNRYVAIKAMAPQWSSDPAARRRFTREAQAAAAVSHPHVITIHAVGEWRGRPFLVMEFVTGASLQQRIDEGGPVELKELLRIGVQIASGLAAAHAQGLIHRDIKPSNIMLENELARVKITDFGLARAVDDTRLTQYGTLAGTPAYMAPEQARGEPLDRRSDLFSLGSVLYAMATGRAAFRGESSVEVIRRVSDGDPTPVRALNPEAPEWLAEVIERLHAKDPAGRFPAAGEVADLLERHLARLQDPSLPPVEHPWVRRPSRVVAKWRELVRRAGVRRLAVPILLLAVAAGSAAGTRWIMQAPAAVAVAVPAMVNAGEPDYDRLQAAYWCNFRDGRYDYRWLHLEPNTPLSGLAKPDRRGFRITIPPKTDCRGVGAFTLFGVHGDFDITASFEILRADKPREGGGVGPELYLRTVDGWGDYISIARLLRISEAEPQILCAWGEKVDGRIQYHGGQEKTNLKAGTFRITRVGSTVRYFVAPKDSDDFRKDSDDFREVYRHEFGTKDLNMVRLMGQVNESGAALDVIWKDLAIAAEALPGWTDGKTAVPQQRSPMWMVLVGLVCVAALGIGDLVERLAAHQGNPCTEGPRMMTTETHARETRWDRGLVVVAAVALAVRLPHLTDRSLWYDESSSWQTAKFSFPEMLRSVRLNVHLPLYYTMLKGWMAVWGESVVSLRGFSIFFGVLTVIAMGLFAGELYRASAIGDDREAGRRWFARVVALLVAVSPYQAFLSLEARMYSLGTTFAAVGAWLLLRALRDPAMSRPWWPFAAACAGLLYTHHYGLFTVAAWFLFLGLYATWLMGAGDRIKARAVVVNTSKVGAVVAAVYLPGMALLRAQVHRVQQDYWIPAMTWRIFSGTFSQFLLPTYAFDFLIGGWVVFGVLVLACLIVAIGGRRGDGLVLASAVGPLAFAAGVSTVQPVWHHRYFVFAHLFLLTALVLAVWKVTRRLPPARWAIVTALVAILLVANLTYWEYFDVTRKTGIRGAFETILAHRRDDEMIVTFDHHQYFPLKFYAGDRVRVRLVTPDPELFWGWHLIRPEDLIELDRLRDELRRGIWVVGKDPAPWESPELSGAEPTERYEFGHYHSLHRHLFVFYLRSAGGPPAREGPGP